MERSFDLDGVAAFDVDAPAAAVTVSPATDGHVHARIHTDRPDDWTVTRSGSTIVVRDDRERALHSRDRVEVTAPAGTDLDVRTTSGDVSVDIDAGRVEVVTVAGDVRVAGAGQLILRTASGDCRVERVDGDLTVRSASGDLVATTVVGDLSATTATGDVHATTVHGELTATTAAGDLAVARYLGDELRARTMAGDVTVGIPTGSSVALDVTTLTGHVDLPTDRPPDRDRDTPPRRVTLHMRSVSGNLTLHRAEA